MGFMSNEMGSPLFRVTVGSTAQNITDSATASQRSQEDHWMPLWKEVGGRMYEGENL